MLKSGWSPSTLRPEPATTAAAIDPKLRYLLPSTTCGRCCHLYQLPDGFAYKVQSSRGGIIETVACVWLWRDVLAASWDLVAAPLQTSGSATYLLLHSLHSSAHNSWLNVQRRGSLSGRRVTAACHTRNSSVSRRSRSRELSVGGTMARSLKSRHYGALTRRRRDVRCHTQSPVGRQLVPASAW